MFPYLYQSNNLTIGSYGIMLALAYLVGRAIFIRHLERQNILNINSEFLIILLLVFGVMGAKTLFLMKNVSVSEWTDWQLLTSASGFSSQGALLSALLVTWIFAKINRIKLYSLLDAAAPAAIIAYALARVGCFLAGDDCWGSDSQLPWAMSFPNGIKPTTAGQTVHPLPLYEVLYSLAIWQYLKVQAVKQNRQGNLFFSLLLLWGLARFLIEFISTNPVKLFAMTGSQMGALLMFLAASVFFCYPFISDKQQTEKTTDKKKPS